MQLTIPFHCPPPLHAGFDDIHNYCFMGRNPRIGTASDFVFGEPLGEPSVCCAQWLQFTQKPRAHSQLL